MTQTDNPLQMIVACDLAGFIGKDGKLPWPKNLKDFKHFKSVTMGSTVIMGRVTYEEILEINIARNATDPYDILPGRHVIVISSTIQSTNSKIIVELSLEKAVKYSNDIDNKRSIFVIGGQMLFTEALPLVKTIHLTVIRGWYSGDRCLPIGWIERNFMCVDVEEHEDLFFATLQSIHWNDQNSLLTV